MVGAQQGRAAPLFNGRDLAGWDSWLGYADARDTYLQPTAGPIDLNHDTTGVFRVETTDGRPAIHVSGKIWGGPLVRGRIQLQSEGAEMRFRDITITPITRLPRIVATGEAK